MSTINRTLLLKRVAQVSTERYPALPALTLHVGLKAAFDSSSTIWDMHCPSREKVKAGKRCIFLKRVPHPGSAVLCHAYSYVSGHTPDQAVLDDLEAKISAEPITTLTGDSVEIVERIAVLVIGETMLIESARVKDSNILVLRALRDLIRRHHLPKHPNLRLEDAPSLEFKRMVQLHGGVSSVTARLQSGFVAEPNTFGDSLEKIVAAKGFNQPKVTTTIEAPGDGELDAGTIETMLEESETGTGLSGITIKFRSGASLGDLLKYREKLPISVNEVRPGVPAINEIEKHMVDYLRSLAQIDSSGFQLISTHGVFT